MDHEHATRDDTTERYLLGELPPEEAGAFEEHYFECRDCAENVRTTAAFFANARAVLEDRRDAEAVQERSPSPRHRGWRQLFAWPALIPAGVFACATLYLAAVKIPQLQRQSEYALAMTGVDSVVLRSETRGGETRIDVPADQRVVVLEFDVNPPRPVPSYSLELRGAGGEQVYAQTVKAPPPGEALHVLVPVERLSSGSYTLIVAAAGASSPGAWSSSYRFALNRERGAS